MCLRAMRLCMRPTHGSFQTLPFTSTRLYKSELVLVGSTSASTFAKSTTPHLPGGGSEAEGSNTSFVRGCCPFLAETGKAHVMDNALEEAGRRFPFSLLC